jgi:polar amino acid transport system substrate-binding protein
MAEMGWEYLAGRGRRIGCKGASRSTNWILLATLPKMFTPRSQKLFKFVPRGTLALISLLLGILSGCSDGRPNNELVVGMDLSYPPFETIDASGQPVGVSVELAKALAKDLDRPLRIENIPFTGLILSLQNGRIDCVISSMTDTEERRNVIGFSETYLSTGLALLVSAKSDARSLEDLDQPGKTLIVRLGTTGETWARSNLRKATLIAMEKENTAVLEVIQGKADGFIYDQMSVWQNQQKNPDTTRALLAPIRKEEWAVGVRKDDEALRGQINMFLKKFRADGGFDRLADEFLKEQKKAFQQQGIPFVF